MQVDLSRAKTDRVRPVSHRRKWYRFSLRTMMFGVTVICLWLGYQLNWIRQRREFLRDRAQCVTNSLLPISMNAPWSLRLLGEAGVVELVFREGYEEDNRQAQALFPEAALLESTLIFEMTNSAPNNFTVPCAPCLRYSRD